MDTTNYVRIFTGKSIHAGMLESRLKELGINPVIKNESESGRLAGFAPPVYDQVQVFVHKDEYEKSVPILQELDKEIEN